MLKKFSLVLLSLFAQNAISGGMDPAGFDDEMGFYIGVDVGVSHLMDNQSTTFPQISRSFSDNGAVGGGLAGYDYIINNRFKLGLEGFMNATDLKFATNNHPNTISYNVRANYNAGMRFLPGMKLAPNVIGHILVGYSNMKFTIKDSGVYGYIDQMINKSGFQCGLGFKITLTRYLSLRTDTLYSTYGTLTSAGNSLSSAYSYQSYVNRFSTVEGEITLVYKFV
ncbi:MAG: porin family protein [Gammaproteobacteria bacterium]|nr:porin family protein [Gammaproteobacteria bacterium]